tara:strand:+ start:100 stop:1173 length:1074 start_codon:yes stop_codon:yes gene_type:complete
MYREFFCAPCSLRTAPRTLYAWLGLAVFLGHQAFKAYLKYALNEWYGGFYDLLQQTVEFGSGAFEWRADMRAQVTDRLVDFCWIVAPAVVVHPIAGLIRNWWVFSWRRCLMQAYVARWNTSLPPMEGAAQRVHEDTQRFAAGIHGCVATLLDALLTLVVFCPILWALDPMLMGVAIATAVGGLGVSALVGHRLVDLEVQNQKAEAYLRKQLVLLEHDPAGLLVQFDTAPALFAAPLTALTINYRRLYLNFSSLQLWLSLYDQVAVLLPYLLVAPRLFAERDADVLTLGALTQTANAFGKVFDSLSVLSENWLAVNEWRSTLRRLREFERELYNAARPVARLVTQTELSDSPALAVGF